jgi:roadblock/LC7 domain-containing protein
MSVVAFDTHALVKKLTATGLPMAQAEAQVEVLVDALSTNLRDLATKDDLKLAEARLDARITAVAESTRQDLIETRLEIAAKLATMDGKISSLESKMDGKFAGMDGKISSLESKMDGKLASMDSKISSLESKMDGKFAALESKMDGKFVAMDGKFASLESKMEARIAEAKTDTIKWVVALGLAQASLLAGILFKIA